MLKNAKLLLVPSLGIVAEIIDQILKEEPQTGRVFNLINQYSAFITLNIVRSESHSPYFCNKESTTAKETSTMGSYKKRQRQKRSNNLICAIIKVLLFKGYLMLNLSSFLRPGRFNLSELNYPH